jgi:hypothetical protein
MTTWHRFHENYEVSNDGQVRSLPHIDRRGRPWPGKVLRPTGTGRCRRYMCVSIDGRLRKVHRLVAEAFLPKSAGRDHVNHKNGDPTDNRAENLEWCTSSENVKHAYEVLGRVSCGGHRGKRGYLHHASREVIAIGIGGSECRYGSAAEAARVLGLRSESVIRTANGKYSHTGGIKFRWSE